MTGMFCTNAAAQGVRLCYCFAACYRWEELGKGHMGFLHYFLQLRVTLQLAHSLRSNAK